MDRGVAGQIGVGRERRDVILAIHQQVVSPHSRPDSAVIMDKTAYSSLVLLKSGLVVLMGYKHHIGFLRFS